MQIIYINSKKIILFLISYMWLAFLTHSYLNFSNIYIYRQNDFWRDKFDNINFIKIYLLFDMKSYAIISLIICFSTPWEIIPSTSPCWKRFNL